MALSQYLFGLFSATSEPADERPQGVESDGRVANRVGDTESGARIHNTEEQSRNDPVEGHSTTGNLPVVYECRRCGTTVTPSVDYCPRCEKPAIAEYVVD